MRIRFLFVMILMLTIMGGALSIAGSTRLPWIVICGVCFVGIFLFDAKQEILKTIPNSAVFLGVFGLLIRALLEPTAEQFWRDAAGASVLIAMGFEQNSEPWSGNILLRSMLTPAIIFFLLVLAQSMPALSADATLTCAISAILVLALMELFSLMREKDDHQTTSCMSSARLATSGVVSLFYCSTFLPSLIRETPFNYVQIIVPALGLILAILGVLLRELRERHILFLSTWSLFIFWTALSGEQNRIFAGIGATMAVSWSLMITHRTSEKNEGPREIFLRISKWAIPGTLSFTFFMMALMPSNEEFIRFGSVFWLLSLFIFWSGLRPNIIDVDVPSQEVRWQWRHSLAVAMSVLSTALLASYQVLPRFLSLIWGAGK